MGVEPSFAMRLSRCGRRRPRTWEAGLSSTERRLLTATLALLGLIPVATGVVGVVLGPVFGPDDPAPSVDVDSEYRFVSVPWMATGLLLWWSLTRLEERATVTRCVLGVLIIGGLGRLVSLVVVGSPMPLFVAALVVELAVVPGLLWWHGRVLRRAGREQRDRTFPRRADG